MIDDGSQDNSVHLIKDLMKDEPRIVLLENGKNKGILYTKTKAILHAKGKYVMTMDEDDIYVQREAFSLLYNEAEKNNLDILGFIFTHSGKKFLRKRNNFKRDKRKIIYQPELGNLMYYFNSKGQVKQFH
jgi:glycosyltransferase involved in cell wall biosynthesis